MMKNVKLNTEYNKPDFKIIEFDRVDVISTSSCADIICPTEKECFDN